MTTRTNEQALEAAIEKHLTGTCLKELKTHGSNGEGVAEHNALYQTGKGYFIGQHSNFNAQFALDEQFFWSFLESTQKEEMEKV